VQDLVQKIANFYIKFVSQVKSSYFAPTKV